jgi:uncharacterized protein YjbI with pentapeptide repeats
MKDIPFECVLTTREKEELRGEVFVNRELVGLDLSGADLRGARFEKTVLVRCNLAGADLRDATFRLCELRTVVFADASFGNNRFDGTTLEDIQWLSAESRALIEQGGGTFQPPNASAR